MIISSSFKRLVLVRQNSAEWLEWREKGVGSSDAAALVLDTAHPYGETADVLWRRKLGLAAPVASNAAMRRGKELEPTARALISGLLRARFVPECFQLHTLPIIASLDGYDAARKWAVEIKCCGKTNHISYTLTPPMMYVVQVVHQMMVADVTRAFLFFYHPDLDAALFEVVVTESSLYYLLLQHELDFLLLMIVGSPPSDAPEFARRAEKLRSLIKENVEVRKVDVDVPEVNEAVEKVLSRREICDGA